MIKSAFLRLRTFVTHLKIRTQFVILLIAAFILSFLFYQFLWQNKWNAYHAAASAADWVPQLDRDFFTDIQEQALLYDCPDSEEDVDAIEALQPFLDLADEYTSLYVYGIEDGLYRAGRYASVLMPQSSFQPLFDFWYTASNGLGEETYEAAVKFKNGYANVVIHTYHSSWFLFPWMIITLVLILLLFFSIILFFIGRKMKSIITLEKEVLHMSLGDLETPITDRGFDEIGSLSHELDHLRLALSENIRQEQESRRANQDLITAMSHDLRTPLTILNGYLEIMQLGRNPEQDAEYLTRCLKKTADLRELTDRMFEYALVYENTDSAKITKIPLSFLCQCILENAEYIRLIGFCVRSDFSAGKDSETATAVWGDSTMIKRIFSNLFSNILKYGDKKEPVHITGSLEKNQLVITIVNGIRQEDATIESNQIGLKSVRKMLALMNGEFAEAVKDSHFTVTLRLPLSGSIDWPL